MPTTLTGFTSLAEVWNYSHYGTVYYRAPLDMCAYPVTVVHKYRNGKLRIHAPGLKFTADAGHLERFGRSSHEVKTRPTFTLSDDGTMDTVVECSECGAEVRFTFASGPDELGEGPEAYDAFVADCIENAASDHVCESDDSEAV